MSGSRGPGKRVTVTNVREVPAVRPHGTVVPEGFLVRRLITRARSGSDRLMLGVCTIEVGSGGYEWVFEDREEVYYIIRGRVKLCFDGSCVEAGEGDAVYLPAGWRYRLENVGDEPALIVYVLTPPLE